MNLYTKQAKTLFLIAALFLYNQSCNTYFGPIDKFSAASKNFIQLSTHYFHRHPVLSSAFVTCSIAAGIILGKTLYDHLQESGTKRCHTKSQGRKESNKADLTFLLMQAIKTGNTEKALEIIASGVDVNKPYIFEEAVLPPLVVALFKGENDIVRCLVEHGANVNTEYNFAGILATPLFAAVWQNNLEIVQYLVEHGANVNATRKFNGSDKVTILHDAILIGNMAMIQYLVEQGADVNAVSIYFSDPCSILCMAVTHGNVDIVSYLAEHGADVNMTCNTQSPLETAITFNDIAMVKCLVEHGADTDLPENSEYSALDIAKNEEIQTYLISQGAQSKEKDNGNKEPLYDDEEFEECDDDQTSLNYSLNTAIHDAIKSGNLSKVKAIIASGADVNATCIVDNYNETPLNLAILFNDVPLAQYLIEHGADVNALTSFGWPCLHDAILFDHLEVLKALVQAGADVNQPDKYGNLALDTTEKHSAIEEYLISVGARSRYAKNNFMQDSGQC